jgi:hypothetical protein
MQRVKVPLTLRKYKEVGYLNSSGELTWYKWFEFATLFGVSFSRLLGKGADFRFQQRVLPLRGEYDKIF